MIQMRTASTATDTITTVVETAVSRRSGHCTFFSSARTSRRYPITRFKGLTHNSDRG